MKNFLIISAESIIRFSGVIYSVSALLFIVAWIMGYHGSTLMGLSILVTAFYAGTQVVNLITMKEMAMNDKDFLPVFYATVAMYCLITSDMFWLSITFYEAFDWIRLAIILGIGFTVALFYFIYVIWRMKTIFV